MLYEVEMTRSIVTGGVLNVNMQKNNKNTFTVKNTTSKNV